MQNNSVLPFPKTVNNEEWGYPVPLENESVLPFDSTIFPEWGRDFVNAVAEETQTPIDAASMAYLMLLSTALGGKYIVKPKESMWTEPINIYSVVALESGNRKSAVLNLFVKALAEAEKELKAAMETAVVTDRTEREAKQKRKEVLKNMYSKTNDREKAEELMLELMELEQQLDERINPPLTFPRFFTSDVTSEKIGELMNEQGGRFAILSSEGSEFFNMITGKYSNKNDFEIYLKAHAGDFARTDRVSGRHVEIDHPCLTLGLFVQPSVIQKFQKDFSDRGLTQRFIYSIPLSFLGQRKISPEPISDRVKAKFYEKIQKLIYSNYRKDIEVLELEAEAQVYLNEIEQEVEIMLANRDISETFKGWIGKLTGLIIRLAGLLHVANHIEAIPKMIPRETLATADRLRPYLIQHTEKALGIINESENLSDLKYILEKIETKYKGIDSIIFDDFRNATKNKLGKSKEIQEKLAALEKYNYAKLRKIDGKQMILVNPKWRGR